MLHMLTGFMFEKTVSATGSMLNMEANMSIFAIFDVHQRCGIWAWWLKEEVCALWQTTVDDLGQIYSWDLHWQACTAYVSLLYNLWFAPVGYFCLFHVCEFIWSARQLKHFRETVLILNDFKAACCSIFINWAAHLCFLLKCCVLQFVQPCLNFHTCLSFILSSVRQQQ